MTAVTPTDRPKSVRNRCVIEVFGGSFYVVPCFLDFSVGVRAFVIGLSQISSFFTYLVWAIFGITSHILNYFVWLRITDEGSVPGMCIWSISNLI